jgi:hypothetical protein
MGRSNVRYEMTETTKMYVTSGDLFQTVTYQLGPLGISQNLILPFHPTRFEMK